MKVLDLQCAAHHGFEGWFGSEGDFQSQLQRGLVACPLCGDTAIAKLPSAPRLNFGAAPLASSQAGSPDPAGVRSGPAFVAEGPTSPGALSAPPGRAEEPAPDAHTAPSHSDQAAFLHAVRHVLRNTEDVGRRFADEARRIHHGEVEARAIRGQASARETLELIDEGIAILPLPVPECLKETLQ
jgi:hypothetical protein